MYYNARQIMAAAEDNAPEFTYRYCESESDYAACVALQHATWGADDVVPVNLLKASQKIGGIVAGAFDTSGRMLGCVFGISGIRDGRATHWSHMLAVEPDARRLGLAYGLKMFQRERLLAMGIDQMRWTYDPLETINAHFNINRLGARPVEYVQDMYGDGESNLLHQGIGTDRFVVLWDLHVTEPAMRSEGAHDAPVLNEVREGQWSVSEPKGARCIRIEAPHNVQALKKIQPGAARAWRLSTRESLQRCLDNGFAITGFDRTDDQRCYYILELKP